MMTIANWCVLAGIVLPYVWFSVANAAGKRDNNSPRDFHQRAEGLAKRAVGAHNNAFEALPAFAAAVVIAQLAHAPQGRVDAIALGWVAARVLHGSFYLLDKGSLRSLAWFAGLGSVVALFVVSA